MRSHVKKISHKLSKLSREQLESLIDEMMDENEGLYSIMESLSTGLIIVNNDYNIIQCNPIVESLLQFTDHFDEQKDEYIPVWNLIDDKEITSYLKKCAEKEITNSSEEFSTTTYGGTVRFISVTINPLITKSVLSGRIIMVRDITERKKQDVLFHRMENMANLTNLAAGMAHEIKNPLGAISIHMQLIQKALVKARDNNDILPPKKFVEDHVDVVNEEVEHLNKLVMDFLFAVRPVNATLQLKNPAALIQNFVDFFKPEFNRFNIAVRFTCSEVQPKIMLDEKLFRDVIMNLAQNALAAIKSRFPECNIPKEDLSSDEIDYDEIDAQKDFNEDITESSREKTSEDFEKNFVGRFDIHCEVRENKYVISMRDNGCGMTSETISKLFEPYYTTKANGTGLGMTMVYKIVKEFSGEIQVESKIDEGTLFVLSFPLPQTNKKLLSEGD